MSGPLTISVDITKNRLPELRRSGRQAVSRGVRAALVRAWQQSIPFTPVRSGQLRSRVDIRIRNGGLSGDLRWLMPYAAFQEEGTRRIIRPVRAKFLVFRGRNGQLIFAKQVRGVTGKHFARKGAERARPVYLADMKRAYRLGGV